MKLSMRPLRIAAVAVLVAANSSTYAAVPNPGPAQIHPIALVGGVVHPVDGPAIPEGTVVFDQGKIVAVGAKVAIPADAERISVTGKHVYPSLIDANTTMGLTEVGQVRATRDMSEAGGINPNVRAQVAANPESELIPVARSNGVLLVVSAPTGGIISGMSALLQLDGWTWEDMTVKAPLGMVLNWPTMRTVTAWWMQDSEEKQLERREEQLKQIRETFADARVYWTAKQAGGSGLLTDARWEAMIPVLEGKLPVVVGADEIQQIQAAIAFAEREGVRIVIKGGYDAPYCGELLKQNNIPVLISGTLRIPARDDDAYDDPFTLPERLRQAGIPWCLSSGEGVGGSSWAVRNLPYHAAMAAAYGLPADEALKGITLYPAQILGVADRVGSLTAGKDATLFVSSGDILEISTLVEMAFVQGRKVDLSDKQKVLWEKYKEKYRRMGIEN